MKAIVNIYYIIVNSNQTYMPVSQKKIIKVDALLLTHAVCAYHQCSAQGRRHGGKGGGGKSSPKDLKKGENEKIRVFSCIKVIKISFSVIFNKEIHNLEGLLS